MEYKLIEFILIFLIGIFIGRLLAKIYFLLQLKKISKDRIKKSKSVIIGQVYEQIAPLLENFKYNPKDAMFLGKGVDYIIFDGLNDGEVKEIIFLEIKTGNSKLNKNEKLIKEAIEKKKIKYEILNL